MYVVAVGNVPQHVSLCLNITNDNTSEVFKPKTTKQNCQSSNHSVVAHDQIILLIQISLKELKSY